MTKGILGRKIGMTAVFTEDGFQVPVTVIDTSGNKVLGKRTESKNGYTALVVGFGEKKASRLNRPELGLFKKNDLLEDRDGVEYAKRHIREFRISAEELAGFKLGENFAADRIFNKGDVVDVTGTSKGRGFSGVMRRHNFAGAKATHGVHEFFRHGGAISACTYPARVFKNKKMPGQCGNERVTIQSLTVMDVEADKGLLFVKGGIPGPNGGLVRVHPGQKARVMG